VNKCGLAPRSKALVLRTRTREVSSPTDRTFQICFAVTLAGYWAARFELVVNLKIAKGLGMTIPEAILLRADELHSAPRRAEVCNSAIPTSAR
jgi:hypothetical protein